MLRFVILFLMASSCFFRISARELDFTETFSRAKSMYREERYDSTIMIIRDYLKKHGREKSTEYLVPLLMEALLREGDISYFKKLISIFRRKFPDSQFIPRMLYLNGIVKAREQEYKKAILAFSAALNKGLAGDLDSLAIVNVKQICKSGVTSNELARIGNVSSLNPDITEMVAYYEVQKLYTSGQVVRAKKRAEDFRRRFPRSSYHSRVKRILKGSKSQQKKNIQIGLLAPVSGDNADIGKFVVQGVQLAIGCYNKTHTPPVELVIMDTRGNMVETAKKARELVHAHRVPIIIGPVLSANATVAASAYMGDADVIMITPTATDDGIAQLGKNIFQMNVTLGILGKRIARYAVENLFIKEFAIISPITEYGRILTANFKKEVIRCGGEILAEVHFDEGMNDFRIQFENLRSKLAERKWEQMALEGQPEYGESVRDRRAKQAYLADSTIEIGGLFIPAESEDVTKIASQVYFHRIRSQLLGSNGWHSNATILSGKRYVDNAVFSTNFETDMKNEKWKSFSKLFWDRFKENPDRVAAPLGYDAANLILNVLQDSDDPEFIADRIRSVSGYHGVSGLISFDNADGVNSEAAVLKISNKKFIRLQ